MQRGPGARQMCGVRFIFPGGHRGGETPVPIPNTVVKPSSADGTAWVTVWESRTLPGVFRARAFLMLGLFVCTQRWTPSVGQLIDAAKWNLLHYISVKVYRTRFLEVDPILWTGFRHS